MLKKYLSNKEFLLLPYNKKVDMVAKLYLGMCTDVILFNKGKLTSEYFAISNFLKKREITDLPMLYNFVSNLPEKQPMGLGAFYIAAKKYDEWEKAYYLRQEKKKIVVENYPSLLDMIGE